MDLNTVLDKNQYNHVYQPIFNLSDWNILGYEGFFRSKLLVNTQDIVSFARQTNNLYKFDTCSLSTTLSTFPEQNDISSNLIFVNVFPSSLLHPSFFNFLDDLLNRISIPCHRIVFEINETEKIENMNLFKKVVYRLRNYGFLIAVDDLGKGESDILKIIELEPQFIKLDRYFSVNLSHNHRKQKFIKLLIEFCAKPSQIILEGIEKYEDLSIAKWLGVPIAQGFLLGKPQLISDIINKNKVVKRTYKHS